MNWRIFTTSRYARQLEAALDLERAEVARLRAENRAFLNSMMIRAGFPPIEEPREAKHTEPMRHRSPQQLSRRLESEAGRKMRNHQELVEEKT